VPIILRGFFSLKDTVTPTVIAIFFVILNLYLSLFFVSLFAGENFLTEIMRNLMGIDGLVNFSVLGLVLAFNIGLLFEFILLFYFFKRKFKNWNIKEIYISFIKVFSCSLLMGIFAYYLLPIFKNIFNSSLIDFILITLVSLLIYVILTIALKMPEIKAVKRLIIKNGN